MMPAGVIMVALLAACGRAQQEVFEGQTWVGFGPKQCVHLTRSKAGSCVISTSCDGLDTSSTEFAFNCITKHAIKRHSYGVGGFETNEEFDSEVKCDRCETSGMHFNPLAPTIPGLQAPRMPLTQSEAKVNEDHHAPKPATHVLPSHALPSPKAETHLKHELKHHHHKVPEAVGFKARLRATHRNNAAAQKGESEPEVAKYGPQDCISTYKSSRGECMVETKCKGIDISKYEVGLICADEAGVNVHHIFGKGSFDDEEKFDTLIACDKCLSPEDGHKVHEKKEAEKLPTPSQTEAKATEKKHANDQQKTTDEKRGNSESEATGKKEQTASAASRLAPLAEEIKELTVAMAGISEDVSKLNAKVFKPHTPAQASAAAPAAGPPSPPIGVSAVQKSAQSHGKHSHEKVAYVQQDDDDDDDDTDEDADAGVAVLGATLQEQKEHVDDEDGSESEEAYTSDDVVAAMTAEPTPTKAIAASKQHEEETGPFGLPVLPVASVQRQATHKTASEEEEEDDSGDEGDASGDDYDEEQKMEEVEASKAKEQAEGSGDDVSDDADAEEAADKIQEASAESSDENEDDEDDNADGDNW